MHGYATAHTDDDYRFVYVGCAGTFTGVHKDVYGSYSWSTNVAGRKQWWLFPPHLAPHLRRFPPVRTSETVHDVRDYDHARFPEVELALREVIIVDQEPGETIFVCVRVPL